MHSCGPLQLLHDIHTSELLAQVEQQPCIHISILKDFLIKHMSELSYDGQQFYTLIKFYLKQLVSGNIKLKEDEKICSWLEYTNEMEMPFLEVLNSNLNNLAVEENFQYDALVNLPQKGYYVASISTAKEEICVWDVKKCERLRTLQGIPQPTALCPVMGCDAAVLCKREIKMINLDEGKFKVSSYICN